MEIRVIDSSGTVRDEAYLKSKYGDYIIKPAVSGDGPVYKITTLREKVEAPATLVVKVSDEVGNPINGVECAFYWPDADYDANAGPLGGVLPQMEDDRCIHGPTGVNGDVGFGMGSGAYYWPDQEQIGPHAAWVYGSNTRSDLILGLGMVALTNHNHFDVEYTIFEEDPDGGDGGNLSVVIDRLDEILEKIEVIDGALRAPRRISIE